MDKLILTVRALDELAEGKQFVVTDGGIEWQEDYEDLPTQEQIEAKIKEIEIEEKINTTKQSLMQLCDSKQAEVQKMVLGYKATPMQLERYKDKYQRAKAGEFDDELNAFIITKHEEYLTAIRKLVDLIEYFRSKVDDLIEASNLDRANECIELAKEFDADTTFEEVKVLLGVN